MVNGPFILVGRRGVIENDVRLLPQRHGPGRFAGTFDLSNPGPDTPEFVLLRARTSRAFAPCLDENAARDAVPFGRASRGRGVLLAVNNRAVLLTRTGVTFAAPLTLEGVHELASRPQVARLHVDVPDRLLPGSSAPPRTYDQRPNRRAEDLALLARADAAPGDALASYLEDTDPALALFELALALRSAGIEGEFARLVNQLGARHPSWPAFLTFLDAPPMPPFVDPVGALIQAGWGDPAARSTVPPLQVTDSHHRNAAEALTEGVAWWTGRAPELAAVLRERIGRTSPADLHFLLAHLAPRGSGSLASVPGDQRAALLGFFGHYLHTDAVKDAMRAHLCAEMSPFVDMLITREGMTNLVDARNKVRDAAPIDAEALAVLLAGALHPKSPIDLVGTTALLATVDRGALGRVVGEHQGALGIKRALPLLPYLGHPHARTPGVEVLFERVLASKLSIEERHFATQAAAACGLTQYREASKRATKKANAASKALSARLTKAG